MTRSEPPPAAVKRQIADTLGGTPRSLSTPPSQPAASHELDERLLDDEALRLHIKSLETLGVELEVTLKRGPQSPAEQKGLHELIAPLVERQVFGAQIQYSAGGEMWLDTLICTVKGVRLVRLRLGS